jgi:signal transduction histidine kinase
MTALPQDEVADLSRLVAELEQRLEASFVVYDEAIARQALLAEENARLQAELATAREREAASTEILRTISEVSDDAERSLQQIVETTARLFDASSVRIRLAETVGGRAFHVGRSSEAIVAAIPAARGKIGGRNLPGTVLAENRQIHVADLDYIAPEMADWPGLPVARAAGTRTISGTPLRRGGHAIGALIIHRDTLLPFTDAELALQQSFADQAAIAVENARLFNEVQARTRDLTEALAYQTGGANILRVIASSPTDVGPVLKAIVESACKLCEAYDAIVFLKDADVLHSAAHHGPIPEGVGKLPIKRSWAAGVAFLDRKPVHILDILSTEGDEFPDGQEASRRMGHRTMLSVPLVREGESNGVIMLRRNEVKPFTDKQILLLETFADQAMIAIDNVRLFDETQARTRELAASLEDLRTAQDRLVQTEKLASLGQLTAGIAHEIKNPLNFVNNFSSLSAELTDELNDVLKSADLADKVRTEVDELTGLLKDNLQKVVQHGKRADSIVKNMLLHSREGSGDHRAADINALLDESLNLAYHGARAEKPQFNVTLQRDFDSNAGMVELFPQEITRVFLNLIGNGFYAVTQRKADGTEGFDPVVSAVTRDLGDHVEIRIRDNGTGIPPDVKEKMFNPFFTTKPAGEGTGLGLSMSHDIVVKQHGGSIEVATEPGQFTEFTVRLPRSGHIANKK